MKDVVETYKERLGATEAEIRGMRKELQRLPVLEGIYGTNDRGDA